MKCQEITLGVARKFLRMLEGESIPFSVFPPSLGRELAEEGIITVASRGRAYRMLNSQGCRMFLAQNYDIRDLEQWIGIKTRKGEITRSEQVAEAGDSMLRKSRVFSGFLVNSYAPVNALLRDKSLVVCPPEGSSLFIEDYEHFHVPVDVVVVGMENSENFQRIRGQQYLFQDLCVLFVARYPRSADLRAWLRMIPNRYIHFGDFDLEGINIFQSEYYSCLGSRAEFLVPGDIEQRIQNGNRGLYEKQDAYRNMRVVDERLKPLVEMIHRYGRGYEQEGYIENV